MLPLFYENLRAMRLEIFMGKENERKVATFMPAILLHSWHNNYLKLEPDHSELAQIQHNWKKSTTTASDCLKEGLVFMGVSISFVFMLCFFMVVRFMIVFAMGFTDVVFSADNYWVIGYMYIYIYVYI